MNSRWKKLISRFILIAGFLVALWLITLYWIKVAIIASAYLPQKSATESVVGSVEYEVFSTVIKTSFTRFSTELILIENLTGLGLLHGNLSPNNPWSTVVDDALWTDFFSRNQKNFELTKSFDLNRPYLLVERNKIENLNRLLLITDNINSTAFLQFSRVGFNSQENKALVHIGVLMPGDRVIGYITFAYGKYFYLEKIDGQWIIQEEWQNYIT